MEKVFNLKSLKERRRTLRQQPVICEKILWHKLRNNKLNNFKFRRQYSVGKYVVDFYCPEIKIAVEIDGATHCSDGQIENDDYRQKYIENLGVKFLRYTNTDVKENLDGVLNDILQKCNDAC